MNTDNNWRKAIEITNKDHKMKIYRLSVLLYLFLLIGLMATISSGCQAITGSPTQSATPTLTITPTNTPIPPTAQPEETSPEPTEEQVLLTPTLAPTATPSQIDFAVEDFTESIGIDDLNIYGLTGEDLANLLVSILIVLLGSLVGVFMVNGLRWLVKQTPPKSDYRIVVTAEKQIKWLIVLILLQFATERLTFLTPELKQRLDLIYFAIFVLVIANIVWKLVDFAMEGPLLKVSSPENRNLLITFAPLLDRSIQVLIYLISLAIILQRFGVNLSALLAVLGLGGLAVSLAAKETLEDMINGFIILIDRPFQIGDRIKIETMDTWGDVVAIGARTTQIKTLDNRLVIVPNSVIGNSQVENFTDPDPSMRIDVTLGIGYGSDIDQVIEIIKRAILSVPGILDSKPPLIEFTEFGDSAMTFRARYWLKTYRDIALRTQVNKSISEALTEANIDMPFITYDVNVAYKNPPPGENNVQTS
jgi:MscS family membrane protein